MSIETMKLAAEFNRYFTSANGVDVPERVSVSRDEWRQLFAALSQQPATTEPVAWPLRAQVWKRESTQEWVLEIAGTLGDTDMNIRHTQPLSVAYENVPGLPTIYTRPAPSVPADVVLDAARYRWLADCNNYEAGLALIIDPKLTAHTLGEKIDAAMLAAK